MIARQHIEKLAVLYATLVLQLNAVQAQRVPPWANTS
jgi:hypothetical protein